LLRIHLRELTLDVIDPANALDRLLGHLAGADQFVELAPGMSDAIGGDALRVHAPVQHAVVSSVLVAHQRAAPCRLIVDRRTRRTSSAPQEGDRILRTAAQAELIDHPAPGIQLAPRIGPDVRPLGLARSGVQHRHRCLVGMQHRAAQHEVLMRFVQRLHRRTGVPGLRRQCRARRVNAGPGVDGLLAVVRQVIDEAADQRMCHQPAGGDAAVDDLGIGRLLHQAFDPLALAAATGPLAVDVAVHEELRRHDVQPFAHILADAGHRLAALRCRATGVLGFV